MTARHELWALGVGVFLGTALGFFLAMLVGVL